MCTTDDKFWKKVERFVNFWKTNRAQIYKRGRPILTCYSSPKRVGRIPTYSEVIHNFSPYLYRHVKNNYKDNALSIVGRYLMGPKKIIHHEWRTSNEYPFVEERTKKVSWPSTSIKVQKGVVPDDIRAALPIKPSKTAKWIGNVNVPVGFRPQKFVQLDNRFSDERLAFMIEGACQYSEFKVTASGSWPTQVVNFQEICDDVGEIDIDFYLEAAKRRSHKLKLPYIREGVNSEEVLSVGTKAISSAGFATGHFIGPTHSTSDKYIKTVAQEIFDEASKEYVIDRSLWSIGGRGRANKITPAAGDIVKSRVVLMPEGTSKIIALACSNAWMRNIVKFNKVNPTNEIGVGLDFLNGRYLDFSSHINSFNITAETDWKAFDTTVSENMLILAFGILRACFPDDEKYDKLFIFQASSVIFKNVVIPGGFVYRISKAIPSGSPWTTALGCIVNWLTWAAVFDGLDYDTHVTCYGDDTVIGANVSNCLVHNFTKQWLDDRIKQVTTLVAKEIKVFDRDLDPNPLIGPTLLKAFSISGLPARTLEDFFSTFVTGGGSGLRHARTWYDLHMKSRGALYNNPFNPKLTEILKELYITTYILMFDKVCPHPNYRKLELWRKDGAKAYTSSKRIADNRFTNPETVFTPKKSIATPWLDAQKFYVKTFAFDPRSIVLRNSYFASDEVIDGFIIKIGTKLVNREVWESYINPPTGPPSKKKVWWTDALREYANELKPNSQVRSFEDFLSSLDEWANKKGYYVQH